MSDEPAFLTVDDVLFLHALQLQAFGGQDGIRDAAGLESAVGMPQAGFGGVRFHTDLFEQAAAYAFHIAQAQAFVDGNKRTGLVSALVFLELNGVEIEDPGGRLYDALIGFATGDLDKPGMAALLRELAGRS